MTISKRLEALEAVATATRNGYRVFFCDTTPGLFWTSPKRGRDGEPALTQADVDKAELSHNVIVVEYVQRWRAGKFDGELETGNAIPGL